MKIAIAGGTGFVGKALTRELLNRGDEVYILTRNTSNKTSTQPNLHYVQWLNNNDKPEEQLYHTDVLINLAGESINNRWTAENKAKIVESRQRATSEMISIIQKMDKKPAVLINASAVGYYGTSLSEVFTEETTTSGDDFLAKTVNQWEEHALLAENEDVRTVLCRFGIILDADAGALPKMALPYQFFIGGRVGKGSQWVSWIHLDDVVHGIIFAIEHGELSGPINFTSPTPTPMNEFGKTLSNVLNRPHWIPAPNFALKTLLGEMSILVLEGQKVLPNKLISAGYSFRYKHLQEALENIYK
ncbi:TIGR01777 family oxidoreductase [Cytobacillus spongiae]|uniref:TIGR01777 family oxidoreductase n=1 Tax=Cytobacillus spongiae TaxID=2901381 RepID=UPI001F422B17|nr:TIGR01777 family oxidoreductase [Cytobacillus spongiae]UII56638.1 TIGR01777 family oxidoreductase [Cytobacillus spongiae]